MSNIQSMSERLRGIASEVETTPFSENRGIRWSGALNELSLELETLEDQPFKGFLEELLRDVSGQLVSKKFSSQITLLHQSALSLKRSFDPALAAQIKKIMEALKKEYRPSLSELKTLADVNKILEKGSVRHFDLLSQEAHDLYFIDEDPMVYEDFLALGEYFFEGNVEEAKRLFKEMPANQRRLIKISLLPSSVLFNDKTATLQALIAAAHLAIGLEMTYPSEEEAIEFFEESAFYRKI